MEWLPLVGQSLDKAITRVAQYEYERLSAGRSPEERLTCVRQALESLDLLASGAEPEYNEWDALFYVTWYQPRQIALALSIMRSFLSPKKKKYHIIDIGCGAFAVQFAVAIAVAAHNTHGQEVVATVQGIEPSEPMRKIGEALWLEFWSIVDCNSRLSCLADVCDGMTSSCDLYDSCDSCYRSDNAYIPAESSSTACWLTAIHTAYGTNQAALRSDLANIRGEFSPVLTIVTSHPSKENVAKSVIGEESKVLDEASLHPWFGKFDLTTAWRRELRKKLSPPPDDIVSQFLKGNVPNLKSEDAMVLYRQG